MNDAPTWTTNILSRPDVTRDVAYAGSVAGAASDVDVGDTITYSKVGGPAWLNVSSEGALTGMPGADDVGTNLFTVRVTDVAGASNDATLAITALSTTTTSYWWDPNESGSGVGSDGLWDTLAPKWRSLNASDLLTTYCRGIRCRQCPQQA